MILECLSCLAEAMFLNEDIADGLTGDVML
jgi:hypothetical protein